jgi:zinc/manganese transport system substrate-binding protein
VKHWHFICLLGALFGFNSPDAQAQLLGHRLHVVTSFPPLYCFAANIAGNVATVDNLLPPGAEPHDFQFSPREMREVQSADVVVVNGLGLESWLTHVMNTMSNPRSVIVATTGLSEADLIPFAPNLEDPMMTREVSTNFNPHTWLDPQLAEQAVANILVAMQHVDPANAAAYATNAAAYITRLQRLDTDMQHELAPFKDQAMVTYHDAFPYLARRYGLKIAGVVERVPEVEPSPRYLEALHRAIEKYHVKVVFGEAQGSQKLVTQIGADYHVTVGQLDTLETCPLSRDAYENGMRANLVALETHLK